MIPCVKCCGKAVLYLKARSWSTADVQQVLTIVTFAQVQVDLVAVAMTLMYFPLAEWLCTIVSSISQKSVFDSKTLKKKKGGEVMF